MAPIVFLEDEDPTEVEGDKIKSHNMMQWISGMIYLQNYTVCTIMFLLHKGEKNALVIESGRRKMQYVCTKRLAMKGPLLFSCSTGHAFHAI